MLLEKTVIAHLFPQVLNWIEGYICQHKFGKKKKIQTINIYNPGAA